MTLNVKDVSLQQKSIAVAVARLTAAGGPPTTRDIGNEKTHYRSYSLELRLRVLGYDAANSSLGRLAARGVVEPVAPGEGQRGRRWKVTAAAEAIVSDWAAYFDRVHVG